ncbi:MAG: hypothetical protein A2X94_17500 [Bdellovibrionales bacterium GWB1_55_8]|nr:MAG: hypothetical protein A2X94_17500 [Bdellovibrionales bacterium GWB1_55_8]
MLNVTGSRLRCPACTGPLKIHSGTLAAAVYEITSGTLRCENCQATYPILAGVAILVEDIAGYLIEHAKGIARLVPDSSIPPDFLDDYLQAKSELTTEHIEEDLEAERVIALYFMNHYLSTSHAPSWFKPSSGTTGSPLIESLIREHWDSGPHAKIVEWVMEFSDRKPIQSTIELGCGVAGLSKMLRPRTSYYLGVDSSFASIALGRHLALGAPYDRAVRIPGDLLDGPVSMKIELPITPALDGSADLIVGNLDNLPVIREQFDLALALNAIDMLDEPEGLPQLQHDLLKKGGMAIQSCPYIWHESVAAHLREILPKDIKDSAKAVEWLYAQSGFQIEKKSNHVPWLFFKHLRQLEIYSVHLLAGLKLN